MSRAAGPGVFPCPSCYAYDKAVETASARNLNAHFLGLHPQNEVMKAMVTSGTHPIEREPLTLQELPDPAPGRGEVRLRAAACGLCHTDLHVIEGELPPQKRPLIPGHQIVGTVDRVGEGATRFREGDRIGVAWLHSTCGRCSFCEGGTENLCRQAQFTGYHVDGGYAQYAIVPSAFAYPLPADFSDMEVAPLLCAGIIGYRALRLSEIEEGQRLGLFGFGASAHIALQVALHWGCEVYVFSRSEEHRDLARDLGAAWTGSAEEASPAPLHGAVLFAPSGALVPQALQMLERGGTLALAGIYLTPIPSLDYTRHLYYEKTVRSVTNSTRQDGENLLRLAAAIPLRPQVQAFPLAEANRALRLLKEGKIQGAGVLQIID